MSDFHFSHPRLLYLLLLLPPLLAWWVWQRRGSVRHPVASRLTGLPVGRARVSFWGGTALRFLALTSLVIAAAGPRWPDLKTRITAEGIAIVMVVDVSKSMGTPDFDWHGKPITRLEAVKRVFRLFVKGSKDSPEPADVQLEGRPTDEIGLVVFGTHPDTACALTLSHSSLLRLAEAQKFRTQPGESTTNISDAIAEGLHRLRPARSRRKVLILLTDGEHNVVPASGWTPRFAARVAAGQGVPIYTVDAAGNGPSLEEGETRERSIEVRQAALQTLQAMAQLTGGHYFRADNTAALLEVYQQIDRKERSAIESYQYRRYHEGYPWFGLSAFVLFMGAIVLDLTIWRRIP
jgi:Ca-activated chloride channel family protein